MSERSERQQRAMDAALTDETPTPTPKPTKQAAKPSGGRKELAPGWYIYKQNKSTRWWDGTAWTNSVQQPTSGWNYVFAGVLISILGGFFFVIPGNLALVVLGSFIAGLGGLVSMVGVIAEGVKIGSRHAAWEQQRREGR